MCVMIAAWELPHGDNNSHWLKFAMVLLILTGHDLIDPYELTNIIFTQSQYRTVYSKCRIGTGTIRVGARRADPEACSDWLPSRRIDQWPNSRQAFSFCFGCRFRRLLCRRPTSFLFPYFPTPCPAWKHLAFSHFPSDISLQTVVG